MSLKDDLELNKPRRTPGHATKSHVVKTNVDGKPKMIRFGEQGAKTAGAPSSNDSAADKAKRKSFKARHASNIAKGPASAAYWADRVKWDKGGPVSFRSDQPVRPGIPFLNTAADVTADTLSGMFGPIVGSAYSLGNQYFTDKSIEELEAEREAVNAALNYTPRTEEGQAASDYAMGKLGEGVTFLADKYNENRDSLGPIPGMIDYGMEKYNELDPETRFAVGNALTVGEVLPIGKAAGMAKRGVQGAVDTRRINRAADLVPDESEYLALQDRLEAMGARQNMVGYHASPHQFSKFDHSKMGTGEGAQAYGWGTYLSEGKKTGEAYLNNLGGIEISVGDKVYDTVDFKDPRNKMAARIRSQMPGNNAGWATSGSRPNLDEAIDAVRSSASPEDIKILDEMIADGLEVKNTGSLYTVDLPDKKIAQMLDWDAPLSEQSENVRDLGRQLFPEVSSNEMHFIDNQREAIHWTELVDGELTPEKMDIVTRIMGRNGKSGEWKPYGEHSMESITGAEIYHKLANSEDLPEEFMKDARWVQNLGQAERTQGFNDVGTSLFMSSMGIPGIRYLDGTSRSAGEGTRNFVVFDESDMTVLTRNGEKVNEPPKPVMFKDVEQPELTPDQLSRSFKDGEITNYGRNIARKRAATDMAGQTEKVKKLSEVLGDMDIEGKARLVATQSDRTGIKDGAGPGYPLIGRQYSEMAKLYQDEFGKAPVPRMLNEKGEITDYPVWAVDAKGTIASLRNNLRPKQSLLVPMLGAPGQLRTNKEIFKKLKKEFMSGVKANKLTKEQADKININLEAFTGLKLDIKDPSSWVELEKTFDGRGALADIMSGKTPQAIASVSSRKKWREKLNKKRAAAGLEPLDLNPATVPLGSRKGQIFDYEKILEDSTESVLLGADTFSVGPTIIKPSRLRQSETMPDAHPGFKEQLMGELASDDIFTPVPLDVAMPNFTDYGREIHMRAGPNKRPFNSSAWGMNARMGYPDQGLPSQVVDEDYLKYLQDMGFAEGGEVEVAEKVVEYNADRISQIARDIQGYAPGGPVEDIYQPEDPAQVFGDVVMDTVSGVAGPIAAAAASLGNQYFTDKSIDQLEAEKAAMNEAMNYSPRTAGGRAINQGAMNLLDKGMTAGINMATSYPGPVKDLVESRLAEYGLEKYQDLDPETKFALGNVLEAGEALPIGMANRGIRNAIDTRRINTAAGNVPDDSAYLDLQDRLEEMGARQTSVKEKGGNWLQGDAARSSRAAYQLERFKVQPILAPGVLQQEFQIAYPDISADEARVMLVNLKQKALEDTNFMLGEAGNRPLYRILQENYPEVYDKVLTSQYVGAKELNDWIDNTLSRYVETEMGTPGDPVKAMAGRGDPLHVTRDVLNYNPNMYDSKYDPEQRDSYLTDNFFVINEGLDLQSLPLAQTWEGASDRAFERLPAKSFLTQSGSQTVIDNPWLSKVPPETPINFLKSTGELRNDLGFQELTSELYLAMTPRRNAALPANLRLDPSKLKKLTVPQAMERVAKIREWKVQDALAKEKTFLMKNLKNSTRVADENFNINFAEKKGGTWVDLPDVMDSPDAMQSCTMIGKAGGWCTMEEGVAEDYSSGPKQLTTLLDADGRPHVQIMENVENIEFNPDMRNAESPDFEIDEIKPIGNSFSSKKALTYAERDPLYRTKVSLAVEEYLNKISETQNIADFVSDDLDMFEIVDLKNNSMDKSWESAFAFNNRKDLYENNEPVQDAWEVFLDSSRRFMNESEVKEAVNKIVEMAGGEDKLRSDWNRRLLAGEFYNPEIGFAKGGAVNAKYDADKINKIAKSIMAENFAEGGPAIYNPSRINEIANRILQEA